MSIVRIDDSAFENLSLDHALESFWEAKRVILDHFLELGRSFLVPKSDSGSLGVQVGVHFGHLVRLLAVLDRFGTIFGGLWAPFGSPKAIKN